MKMTRSELLTLIKENVESKFDIDTVRASDRLMDLGIDSLGFVTLLWCVEDRLGIQVEDDAHLQALNASSTIEDLVIVYRQLGYEISID